MTIVHAYSGGFNTLTIRKGFLLIASYAMVIQGVAFFNLDLQSISIAINLG